MKQAVLRKTLTGSWTEFAFTNPSRFFFVKNLSEDNIFVSFESGTEETASFLIPSMHGEEVAMSFGANDAAYYVTKIYVKGTGDVEVQAMDAVA